MAGTTKADNRVPSSNHSRVRIGNVCPPSGIDNTQNRGTVPPPPLIPCSAPSDSHICATNSC